MTGEPLPHRLYGRRKGKPLRRHHSELVSALLPEMRVDLAAPGVSRDRPGRLEIGFGGGEHLAHRAASAPEAAFLGAEAFINGTAKLLTLIERQGLRNIRIHDGDARDLIAALPDQSLDTVYLLYPDPWPKPRHRRRRFVNAETLGALHRLLVPGGLFQFASDIPDYVAWTLIAVRDHGGFDWLAERARDWREPPPGWIETRYEAKARREGRTPCYLAFRRRP